MIEMLKDISGQSLQEYLWPDVDSPLGRQTALCEGAIVAAILGVIYFIAAFAVYKNGIQLSEEIAMFVDASLFRDIKIIMNLACVLSAVYYIRAISVKESRVSIVFLLLWIIFELLTQMTSGLSSMFIVYGVLMIGAINAYRVKPKKL